MVDSKAYAHGARVRVQLLCKLRAKALPIVYTYTSPLGLWRSLAERADIPRNACLKLESQG